MVKLFLGTLIVCICLTQIVESFKLGGLTNDNENIAELEDNVPVKHIEKRESENDCVPGKRFQRDCNTCMCSDDGKSATCTLRGCPGVAGNTVLIKLPQQ